MTALKTGKGKIRLTLQTIKGIQRLETKAYDIQYREEEPPTVFVDKDIKLYRIVLRFYLIFN